MSPRRRKIIAAIKGFFIIPVLAAAGWLISFILYIVAIKFGAPGIVGLFIFLPSLFVAVAAYNTNG